MKEQTEIEQRAMMTTLKRHITIQTVLAFVLTVFGMAMVMLALYLPPVGEIHPSVITVFGMLLVAAGAFIGIDLNFRMKPIVEQIRYREQSQRHSTTGRSRRSTDKKEIEPCDESKK